MTTYNPGTAFRPSSGYGQRINPISGSGGEFHPGQDFSAHAGTLIPAASSARVGRTRLQCAAC